MPEATYRVLFQTTIRRARHIRVWFTLINIYNPEKIGIPIRINTPIRSGFCIPFVNVLRVFLTWEQSYFVLTPKKTLPAIKKKILEVGESDFSFFGFWLLEILMEIETALSSLKMM